MAPIFYAYPCSFLLIIINLAFALTCFTTPILRLDSKVRYRTLYRL
jgi:hypothetical protein